MKTIVLIGVFLALVSFASAYVVLGDNFKNADKEFLVKQKIILEVLRHVYQPEFKRDKYRQDAEKWKIDQKYGNTSESNDAIEEFVKCHQFNIVPNNVIFTVMNNEHRKCAIGLYNIFYYAKDWNDFYHAFVWASQNVNKGMFVYALTVALLHRPDMVGMELPSPYEIFPHYFFNSDVIHRAQSFKMRGFKGIKKVEGIYNVIIETNYTSENVHMNFDQKVEYFTEDIGLNTYYYYLHTDYPFWLGGDQVNIEKDRRGELWLYELQQILARYYLERLSNDLGDIPDISWHSIIKSGYFPNLHYPNGVSFPSRPNNYKIDHHDNEYAILAVKDQERYVRDAINKGFVEMSYHNVINFKAPEAIDFVGNILQGNPDFYPSTKATVEKLNNNFMNRKIFKPIEVLAAKVFEDKIAHKTHTTVIPSVLSHYETALRDPVTYQLLKRFVRNYWMFKNYLEPYKNEEINFPGVSIENVEHDKFITYFDRSDSDITNAVEVETNNVKYNDEERQISKHNGHNFVIKARQWRLNHIPFTIKINVKSEEATKGVLRVYMGPKYDFYGNEIKENENRKNWWHLTTQIVNLNSGKTSIVLDSQNLKKYVRDRTPYHELYKWVMDAYDGKTNFPLDMTEAHCGFPHRLILPRGKKMGMQYQFYFIISPYNPPKVEYQSTYNSIFNCGVGSGSRYIDDLPLGYPFDRKIDMSVWNTPNMLYHDVMVYHKTENDINTI